MGNLEAAGKATPLFSDSILGTLAMKALFYK
jgi:hypothetical protein